MITKLTKEQESQLSVYRDKWIAIGLATGPVDFEAAKLAATKAYEAAGLKPPSDFYRCRDPLEAATLAAQLRGNEKPTVDDIGAMIYGAHDAAWLSFYDYMREVLGLSCCDKLEGLLELAKCCGWWAPYENAVIFQDRPSAIHLDDAGRLHCDTGKAIEYPSGWGIYSIHGVTVPEIVVMQPEAITEEMIWKEDNHEVRRVMIERYGADRLLSSAEQIDFDFQITDAVSGSQIPRGLYKMKDGSKWMFCTDGSTEHCYALPMPSYVNTCRQGYEAITGRDESKVLFRS